MSLQNKFIGFAADIAGSPLALEKVLEHAAPAMETKVRTLKAEVRATLRARAMQPPDGPTPTEAAEGLCYDGTSYWRKECDGTFARLGREDTMLHLRRRGLSPKKIDGTDLSPVEEGLFQLQTNNRVDYAAPLCGRAAGRYVENGIAVLATNSPTIIQAKEGDDTALVSFITVLLGELAHDPHWHTQFTTFLAWLQRARAALHNPAQHLPGQLLALVGAADGGKTLLQTLLTKMLGGRQADPALWLTGKSDFNDGIWAAEHWAASDSNIADTPAARKMLRDRVKEATANESLGCHRKHRGEITLRPIARLTLSANDDADSTFVLPPLDTSIRDKVIYLKCYRPPTPFPTASETEARAFFKSLTDAIPAFLHRVESFEVPAEMRKGRFGVKEWHHPAIVELLGASSPDRDIADRLTEWLDRQPSDYVGPAVKLYDELLIHHGEGFRRECGSSTKLGQVLGRLGRVEGWVGRIEDRDIRIPPNNQRQTQWTIRKQAPPQAGG